MIVKLPVVVINELLAVNVTIPDIVKSAHVRLKLEVSKVPPVSRKFPAQVRSCVAILMVPLVTVRLYVLVLALMDLPEPDIEIVDVP
jgi:hypothetical protein